MSKNYYISIQNKFKLLIPESLLNELRYIYRRFNWKGSSKIFCISMQRSGTTSVGDFFNYFGYPTANYSKNRSNLWSEYWFNGDFESIFNSKEFKSYQVFEDNPWWSPDFYKVLYHRFPNAKFILMDRESDDWFNSMLSHSKGKTLGNTKRHCKVYRREAEFYRNLDFSKGFMPKKIKIDNLMELSGNDEHYKSVYKLHTREVIDFFRLKKSEVFFYCNLYDKDKWYKLGIFLEIDVPKNFEMHSNQTNKNFK